MSTTETKIAQNRVYAKQLGWFPSELGATDFNTLLVTLIAAQQQVVGADVDGVCGPATYKALLAHKQADLIIQSGKPGADRLKIAGEIAVCELKRDWLTDIIDLPAPTATDYERCRSFIDDTIRSTLGIHWYWEKPYPMIGGFKWCGAMCARGQAAAGLKLAIREKFFASTYRLDRWARYEPIDATDPNKRPLNPPQGSFRQILELNEHSKPTDAFFSPGDPPRAGDIAIIGPVGGTMAYGVHIITVESFDVATGLITSLEGNGTGFDPHGNHQHGVVRAQRPIGLQGGPPTTYHVRRLIRIALHDLASS